MPDLHGSRRTECSLHLSVASSHLVRSSVEEKRGEKKRGEPRKTIKLQYKCQRVKRVWIVTISVERKKRLNISEPRAPRSLEFLHGQRQKLLFTLKFAAGREEWDEALVVDGITTYSRSRYGETLVRTNLVGEQIGYKNS